MVTSGAVFQQPVKEIDPIPFYSLKTRVPTFRKSESCGEKRFFWPKKYPFDI